jgi:hypothetical protein
MQDGVLTNGVYPDSIQGVRLKADAVSTAKDLRIVHTLEMFVYQKAAVSSSGKPGLSKEF